VDAGVRPFGGPVFSFYAGARGNVRVSLCVFVVLRVLGYPSAHASGLAAVLAPVTGGPKRFSRAERRTAFAGRDSVREGMMSCQNAQEAGHENVGIGLDLAML